MAEKKNYGKVSMGVVRTTYLIDEEGMIVKALVRLMQLRIQHNAGGL
jgi:peroxiredoxin